MRPALSEIMTPALEKMFSEPDRPMTSMEDAMFRHNVIKLLQDGVPLERIKMWFEAIP